MSWWSKSKPNTIKIESDKEKELYTTVWLDGFSEGFSKAWDMMAPLQTEGVLRMRRQIEEQAIQSILDKKNGRH